MITIIGATHPGQRDHNEDCYAANTKLGLGLVADGMGGYACGEVASDLVKTSIEQAAANDEGLTEAILKAHEAVKASAELDASKKGMGSTAIAVKMRGLDYELAWVGDSRAYLWDGISELKQLTRDHSYVESLLSTGAISYEEAINHPNRNLITQAVGVESEAGLEIGCVKGRLVAGQQLVLCSDGLVDEVLDVDIARLMDKAQSPEEALSSLVHAAVAAGGHDNITVVIVTVDQHLHGSKGHAIEPEIVRSTSIDNSSVEPSQSGPALRDDITRSGDKDVLSLDRGDSQDRKGVADVIVDNIPACLIAIATIMVVVAVIFILA